MSVVSVRVFALSLAVFVSIAGCSKKSEEPGGGGASMDLSVDGKAVRFEKRLLEFDDGELTLYSHDGEMNRLVIEFGSEGPGPDAWVGRALRVSYRADNPEKHRMGVERNLNRFRANGNYYEALDVGATLREVKGAQATLDLDGTFLEFKDDAQVDDDDSIEVPGREVPVRGTVTLPLVVVPRE